MAPRAKPPALLSSELVRVRLTPGERRAYELAAKAAKQDLSGYIRLVVGTHIATRGPAAAARVLTGE